MFRKIKKQIDYFVCNKWYMISLVIVAIAGYGYEITHSSMGVDDVCIGLYFDEGLGVAIGRWPYYLINKVFHVTDFQPFIMEFIAVCFLLIAAILWACLIRYIMGERIPMICYIVFSAMIMVYSLIAEVFIFYLQNGVPIIYGLLALSLFGFYYVRIYKLAQKQRIQLMVGISAMMSVAIAFYESAANIFLFGVCMIMILDCVGRNQMQIKNFKSFFLSLFMMVRILIYAIIARSLITKLCMILFNIEPYNVRSVKSALWILKYPGRIQTIVRQIFRDYFVVGWKYYPIGLFVVASIAFVCFIIVSTVRKKNAYILLLGTMCYGSLFALALIQGDVLPYRSNQMLAIFVAIVLFGFCYWCVKCRFRIVQMIGIILSVSVIYNSAFDLNKWFAFEYEKNQNEIAVVHEIGMELLKGEYDITNKPVVFIGEYRLNDAVLSQCSMSTADIGYDTVESLNSWMEIETPDEYTYVQTLASSLINWSIQGLYKYEGYNKEIIRLFQQEGYQLQWGGNELYEKALENIEDINRYPVDGYIKEYEDYIAVRF